MEEQKFDDGRYVHVADQPVSDDTADEHQVVVQRERLDCHAAGILVFSIDAHAHSTKKAATRSRSGRSSLV